MLIKLLMSIYQNTGIIYIHERKRETERETETERQRETKTDRTETVRGRERELDSQTLILKDSSVSCIWTYLTASPCYTTNTNKHTYTTNIYYQYE